MRQWIVAAAAAAVLWPVSAEAAAPEAEQMANRVAQTLRESGQLKNYRVGVKYKDGVAWLIGEVTSAEQSATAERLASQAPGVSHVVNKLAVKSTEQPAVSAENSEDLLLAALESASPEAAPAPLPPNPEAMPAPQRVASRGMPRPMQRMGAMPPQQGGVQPTQYGASYAGGGMTPQGYSTAGAQGVSYDGANMPGYAWPSYAAHPNYAAVSYPQQYSPAAWPYIGPFYPYPQVPLGWRKVTLEWDDGWWYLDFSHRESH